MAEQNGLGSLFVWSLILIVVLVVLFMVLLAVRRWMTKSDDIAGGGFTLGDLRALRRQGKMTDEEFERARAQMIAGLKGKQAAAQAPSPPPPPEHG